MYPGVPTIGQYEVDQASAKLFGERLVHSIGQPYVFMHTQEALRQAVEYIQQAKLLQEGAVAIVAHPHHVPRADATLQALLPFHEETVVPGGIEPVWDSCSADLWTRRPAEWPLRDELAIGRFAMHGWLDLRYAA
jgi:hypothetical protein